jgi:hypothetical protein
MPSRGGRLNVARYGAGGFVYLLDPNRSLFEGRPLGGRGFKVGVTDIQKGDQVLVRFEPQKTLDLRLAGRLAGAPLGGKSQRVRKQYVLAGLQGADVFTSITFDLVGLFTTASTGERRGLSVLFQRCRKQWGQVRELPKIFAIISPNLSGHPSTQPPAALCNARACTAADRADHRVARIGFTFPIDWRV